MMEKQTHPKKRSLSSPVLLTIILLIIWLICFIVGATFDSSKYRRELLRDNIGFIDWFLNLIYTFFSWTWSNVLILCCISTLVGEYTRRSDDEVISVTHTQNAIIRGFFIFLTVVTGQIVIQGSIPSLTVEVNGNPAEVGIPQYFRVASFSSLLSFLVGFNPRLFNTIVKRLDVSEKNKNQKGEPE